MIKFGRKRELPDNLQGSVSEVESDAGASRLGRFPNSAKTKRGVSPTYESKGASHNPALYYEVQDEDGKVRTYFETHPAGSRKIRRYRRRHNPRFTKKATGGRDWQVLQKARQREENESNSLRS